MTVRVKNLAQCKGTQRMFLRYCYYFGVITKVTREVLSFFRYGGSRRVPGEPGLLVRGSGVW